MARLSWAARLYIGAVVLVAAAVIVHGPFGDLRWWRNVAVLGLLLVVFESTATLLRPRQLAWSPNSAATLAAAVLLGPVGAGLVGACTMFGMRRGPSVAQRAFNTGMMALSAYL
ncbi:MAG: metal-dependent phosphohydrolase, partial [Streptosporangiaceae bacterium]